MMRAARVHRFGPVHESVTVGLVPPPTLTPGHLLVKVHAAALNPIDWKMATGTLPRIRANTLPFTIGSDFAGVVEQVADGIPGPRSGDPVYGMAGVSRGGSGSCAELASVDPRFVSPISANIPFEEAAAVPMTGLRAWSVLHDWLRIQPGERVLVHGGAGGLGTFAIQIAKHLGADVATTVSERDRSFVEALGATTAIDYHTRDFTQELSSMDAVFDTVGGETYTRSFAVLKRGGRIATMLGASRPDLAREHAVTVVEQAESATPRSFQAMNDLMEKGVVKAQIDRVFSLDSTAAALDHLQNGHPRGKVVVRI